MLRPSSYIWEHGMGDETKIKQALDDMRARQEPIIILPSFSCKDAPYFPHVRYEYGKSADFLAARVPYSVTQEYIRLTNSAIYDAMQRVRNGVSGAMAFLNVVSCDAAHMMEHVRPNLMHAECRAYMTLKSRIYQCPSMPSEFLTLRPQVELSPESKYLSMELLLLNSMGCEQGRNVATKEDVMYVSCGAYRKFDTPVEMANLFRFLHGTDSAIRVGGKLDVFTEDITLTGSTGRRRTGIVLE